MHLAWTTAMTKQSVETSKLVSSASVTSATPVMVFTVKVGWRITKSFLIRSNFV